MYDSRSEAHEFVGLTREEAVAKACRFFELDEGELAIAELPAGEVYGLGSRFAVVARPRSASQPAREPREREGRDRGARDRGPRDRGPRDRSSPRGRARPAEDRPAERPEAPRRPALHPREAEETEAPPDDSEMAGPSGPSRGEALTPLGDIGEFVRGVVERMDAGPFEVAERSDGEVLAVTLSGEGAQRLVDRDSRVVEAIKLLAIQTALRAGEGSPRRIVVEAEGDAERRESFLQSIADRAARRALGASQSIALEPMNARDRRAIHVALREVDDVATMSIGSGRYRQVVVVPRSAPEWDEARAYEEAASSGEE